MEIVVFAFVVVFVIMAIGVSLFGALFAFCTSSIVLEFIVPALVVLLVSGVYLSLVPLYSNTSKTTSIAASISIAVIYTAIIACGITAIAGGYIILQYVVAAAAILNLIVVAIFLFNC